MPLSSKLETNEVQTAQAVEPAANCSASYRLLFNGDLLAEGCESLQDDAETWIPTEPAFWGTYYNCEFFRPMRMPNS
jgi:ketosteroid isomerase-like protein